MFGLSDAECFLLGWAVGATIMAFRWKSELDTTKNMFMHFVKNEQAREEVVKAWEKFKKAKGA